VRYDRASACGTGLERELWTAGVPVPVPNPEPSSVLGVALSGAGLHGSSGRPDRKSRRGGTRVVFSERRDDVASAGSALGPALLPSRPDEHRREVKSVKSTVRDWARRRRMDGWRVSAVSGGADGAAVEDGGAHPSGGCVTRENPILASCGRAEYMTQMRRRRGDMRFLRGWGTIQDKRKIGRKKGRTRAGVWSTHSIDQSSCEHPRWRQTGRSYSPGCRYRHRGPSPRVGRRSNR
jgi:hypothetical protein